MHVSIWERVSFLGFLKVCVFTGKTPASPNEYGSFGEYLKKQTFSLCDVIVWLPMNEESSPPQPTTAAQWVQRPLPTAPLQLTTTMDTWVWANRDSHILFSLFLVFLAHSAERLEHGFLAAPHPHWFSVCLCSLGQEPFKRRPILNHLHYIAIRIGDTLPYN